MRNHRALPCTSCARHGFGGKCLLTKKEKGAVGGLEPPSAPCHRSEYISEQSIAL